MCTDGQVAQAPLRSGPVLGNLGKEEPYGERTLISLLGVQEDGQVNYMPRVP